MADHLRVEAKDTGIQFTIPDHLYNADVHKKLKDDPYDHRGLPAAPVYPETSAKKAANTSSPAEKKDD